MKLLLSLILSSMASIAFAIDLVPTPAHFEEQPGACVLPKNINVQVDEALKDAPAYLAHMLRGTADVTINEPQKKVLISISLVDSLPANAYTFVSNKQGITIGAGALPGAVAAMSTLLQLLPPEALGQTPLKKLTLPCVTIRDEPRYAWRGLMMDVSRHFFDVDEIKQVLDLMALYKFSRFHWHLADNEGWRIEIKRYPELTTKGAWRKYIWIDEECMRRCTAEQNEDYRLPAKHHRVVDGDTLYGGFFTQDDIREVVRYAAARGIEVIPEIDMPGHFSTVSGIYGLSCQGKVNDAICPGRDDVMAFCKNIFSEIFELFPSKVIYIGGDEVNKTPWKTCPDCQRRIAEEGLQNEEELQAWFMRQMEVFFRVNGRHLMGWDEITHDGLSSDAYIAYWRSSDKDGLGVGASDAMSYATSHGMHTMCCPTKCMYFDYPQDLSCMDRILAYDPLEGLSPQQQRFVLGLQANLWAEFIPSIGRLYYQALPRMFALAESAWSQPETKSHTSGQLIEHLKPHLKRLKMLGIKPNPLIEEE